MAISIGTITERLTSSPLTVTVGAGVPLLMFHLHVQLGGGGGVALNTLTWDGGGFTGYVKDVQMTGTGYTGHVWVYYMVNPTPGTHTIAWTLSASTSAQVAKTIEVLGGASIGNASSITGTDGTCQITGVAAIGDAAFAAANTPANSPTATLLYSTSNTVSARGQYSPNVATTTPTLGWGAVGGRWQIAYYTITPAPPPTITQNPPSSVNVAVGDSVTLVTNATGYTDCQWSEYYGGTWHSLSVYTPSYTFTPTLSQNGHMFACAYFGSGGSTWTTNCTVNVKLPSSMWFVFF